MKKKFTRLFIFLALAQNTFALNLPDYNDGDFEKVSQNIYKYLKNKLPVKYQQFKHIAGFYKEGFFIPTTKNRDSNNDLILGPKSKEKKSVQTYFKLHLRSFLSDPEYRCNVPSTNLFFKHLFNDQEPFETKCPNEYDISFMGLDDDDTVVNNKQVLDPSRIYQVHYVRAGRINNDVDDKNRGVMNLVSKFGHSMLRIVICPKGVEYSEQCLLDAREHTIVSFTGVVDGSFNPLKGFGILTAYPMEMSYLDFPSIADNYNSDEDRNLYSLPIEGFDRSNWDNLSYYEKEKIDRTMEMFVHMVRKLYFYQEKYRFVNSNCATSIVNLLKAASDDSRIQGLASRTPIGLIHDLIDEKLVDKTLIDKNGRRLEGPYIFGSLSNNMKFSWEKLKNVARILKIDTPLRKYSLSRYVTLSEQKRKDIYHDVVSKLKTDNDLLVYELFDSYFDLEEDLSIKLSNEEEKSAGQMLSDAVKGKEIDESTEQGRKLMDLKRKLDKAFSISIKSKGKVDITQVQKDLVAYTQEFSKLVRSELAERGEPGHNDDLSAMILTDYYKFTQR